MNDTSFKPAGLAMAAVIAGLAGTAAEHQDVAANAEAETADLAQGVAALMQTPPAEPLAMPVQGELAF